MTCALTRGQREALAIAALGFVVRTGIPEEIARVIESTRVPHEGSTKVPHEGSTRVPHEGSTRVPHDGSTTVRRGVW
jgi:hypothetical protein